MWRLVCGFPKKSASSRMAVTAQAKPVSTVSFISLLTMNSLRWKLPDCRLAEYSCEVSHVRQLRRRR